MRFSITLFYLYIIKIQSNSSAANKGWSTVNYRQSSALDHPYLSCNNHCDWWIFPRNIFLLLLLLFPRNSFERPWICFLGIYILLQNTQNKFVFFLFVHSLLFVSKSLCVLRLSTFLYFSTACKYADESTFSFCLLFRNQSVYYCSLSFAPSGSLAVQKRKLKALIWPPIHFFVKFNNYLNMNNLFVCIIMSENSNEQYLVSYFYKHVAFVRVFL